MIEGGSCGFCALSLDLCINCCALPLDNTIPATNEVLFWNVVGCGDDGKFLDDLIVASDEVGMFVVQSHKRESCRSDEHTSELQSLMRTSYSIFGLKKKNT